MNSLLKKCIGGVILASIVAGALFVPISFAIAQSADDPDFGTLPSYVPDSTSPTAADQNKTTKPPADKGKVTTKGCFGNPLMGQSLINFDGCAALVANLIMWLAARVLWLSGGILNIAIGRTLDMAGLLHDLPIVDIGWKIIRDISNIVFIFIALWSGISITLGLGDNGSKGWGLLAQMVLVALFINFSLFITKAVVDASNIAALHFYNLIRTEGQGDAWDGGLSSAFMQGLRIQTIYDPSTLRGGGSGANTSSYTGGAINMFNIILIGFFGSIFMLVAAFVFFAAAIMFIIRIITLVMLMVLSPLAFVSWLLPGASGLASTWWSKLWSQSFFAPLYLALAYIVVATINSPAFRDSFDKLANNGTLAAALTGTTYTPVIIIFNFIILIGLMVGCLVVAQSLGARGSDLMMSWGQKLKGEGTSFLARGAVRGFGLGKKGEDWQEKNAARAARGEKVSLWSKAGAAALKYSSIRNLNERLGQTKFGQYGAGKFLREQTTGRLSEAKFGGSKSAEEAYEESEHDASVRQKIGYLAEARRAGVDQQRLRGEQGERYAARFAAQRGVVQAQAQVSQTMTPEVTAQQQQDIADARNGLNTAEQNLTHARATPGVTQQVLDQLQQNVTQAQQNLAQAQTPQWSAEQQQIQTALAALAQAERDLAANPNDPALVQARDRARDQLNQASPEHRELATAQQAVQQADARVSEFNSTHGQEIAENTKRMSKFLGKLSPKEFMEYMPKAEFFNPALMSPEVLSTTMMDALMKDEHTLTEPEKDAAMDARLHGIIEVGKRGEDRWAWFHDAIQRFQRAQNAREAAQLRVETELTLPSGITLRAELDNIDGLQTQLAAARAVPPNQRTAQHDQLIQTLEQDINARRQAVHQGEQDRDARLQEMTARGELERPKMPEQPGWDEAPELRKALRNMRGLTEMGNWYQHARESLDLKLVAQTIMQGVWSDVRKSEQFDSDFKENTGRAQKRSYVRFSGDLTAGFDPNVTDEIAKRQGFAMNELRRIANKRLTELGPEEYFRQFDQGWTDTDGQHESIQEQYLALVRTSTPEDERQNVERAELAMSTQERMDVRFNAGMTMYNQVAPNLASDEFTLMQGQDRDLYPVMRNLEESQIRHYANRDLDVKIPMVEFLLGQFQDEVIGIRNMSRENANILTWFVNKGGQDFIPWEKIRPELKESWEQVKSVIGRIDARALPSIYPRLKENPTNDAPVIIRMNEVRAAERTRRGLPPAPPLTPRTQPLGRIGAVA